MARKKKPQSIKISLLARDEEHKGDPYAILDRLVARHHDHLAKATIGLAWNLGWRCDADGHVKLGKAQKCREADRQAHGLDFIILLNRDVWQQAWFTEAEMEALLDHELSHCGVRESDEGETILDEKGRPVYRMRKHDIEEFRHIVRRHGCWKSDLVAFVQDAVARDRSLFSAKTPAPVSPAAGGGTKAEAEAAKAWAAAGPAPSGDSGDAAGLAGAESGGNRVTLTPETKKLLRRRRKAAEAAEA
jgi:hypothetical protein